MPRLKVVWFAILHGLLMRRVVALEDHAVRRVHREREALALGVAQIREVWIFRVGGADHEVAITLRAYIGRHATGAALLRRCPAAPPLTTPPLPLAVPPALPPVALTPPELLPASARAAASHGGHVGEMPQRHRQRWSQTCPRWFLARRYCRR